MAKEKILVVDDEDSICEILQLTLMAEGYEVDVAYSAEEALMLPLASYSLLLLDVMMGEMSGFRMVQQLRKNPETEHLPVIFCTAKDTKDDTIIGLNLGADDYIAKPFLAREVVARVKSVLRRSLHQQKEQELVTFASLSLNRDKKICLVSGENVPLTKKEFELLLLFLENRDHIFSRTDILHRVWTDDVVVTDRTVDVFITRLRKKIGAYGSHIVTRLGFGYGFYE
ncbi:MAG: response regulator transcription factor [Bacteroidaceae bacterium]